MGSTSALHIAFGLESFSSCLLTVTFTVFHVEMFLTHYALNLAHYAVGHLIFAVINTVNDVLGAWLVDALAAKYRSRVIMVKYGGGLWALMFLTIWFRTDNLGGETSKNTAENSSETWGPLIHFILSMSAYDTMYSFCAIVTGSIITELNVEDSEKVKILRTRAIVHVISGILGVQLGQIVYNNNDLTFFRMYLVMLSILSCLGFFFTGKLLEQNQATEYTIPPENQKSIGFFESFWSVLKLKNFRYWLGMEMFLETQNNFNYNYLRIFLFHFAAGKISKESILLIVTFLPPFSNLFKLILYSFVQKLGIYAIYKNFLITKIVLSAAITFFIGNSNWIFILIFIIINFILNSVPSIGFNIVISNLNEELQFTQIVNQGFVNPSVAGMFMGVNAVFCKPMDSLLPILAANMLKSAGISTDVAAGKQNEVEISSENNSDVFFQLLVFPPLILGIIQLLSWNMYSLRGKYLEKVQKVVNANKKESKV